MFTLHSLKNMHKIQDTERSTPRESTNTEREREREYGAQPSYRLQATIFCRDCDYQARLRGVKTPHRELTSRTYVGAMLVLVSPSLNKKKISLAHIVIYYKEIYVFL